MSEPILKPGMWVGEYRLVEKLPNKDKYNKYLWLCEDRWGDERVFGYDTLRLVVRGKDVLNGTNTFIHLIGREFDDYRVVKYSHYNNGNHYWELWDGNGNRKTLSTSRITGYKTIRHYYQNYKSGARRKGRDFSLTIDEFEKFIMGECYYCSAPANTTQTLSIGHGIDRVDSSKGYVKGNVVTCCNVCNYMKGSLTTQEFLEQVSRINSHRAVISLPLREKYANCDIDVMFAIA
jgi:5-methylcytosine-specific restriction endonuclease McrA